MATAMTLATLEELRGKNVYSADGEKIGVVDEIFTDDATDRPEFIGIGTGILRTNRALVPVEAAEVTDDDTIVVPHSKDRVKNSPDVEGDVIDPNTEKALYDFYGVTPTRDDITLRRHIV